MQNYFNIEKSKFKRGEYVGYGAGTWRIYRSGELWYAVRQQSQAGFLSALTLGDLSDRLAEMAEQVNKKVADGEK